MKKSLVVAFMALLATELLMTKAANGFDCQAAKLSLLPCVEYLFGGTDSPSEECCGGVSSLKNSTTPADRRAASECLEAAANHYPGSKSDRVAALPKLCHVQLGFPISKDMNCSRIHQGEGNGEKMNKEGNQQHLEVVI